MENRYETLDGWRGVSILLVLMGHLLPVGPKSWQLNGAVAASGMAIFFILSGFLITSILIKNMHIGNFLIRRFLRIIPLAWLVLITTLVLNDSHKELFLPHLLFYANWEPMALTAATGHFWSLCVEMQFYLMISLLVSILRFKAFYLLPLFCVYVTGYRYFHSAPLAINTYYRIDEILAGCILALLFNYQATPVKQLISKLNPFVMLPLLLLSAHPKGGVLNYFRPYIAMLLVGGTLFKGGAVWWSKWLNSKILVYLATISYALYVFHGVLMHTYLGQGATLLEKYAKRPLLFIATFGLAHMSTRHYEKYWIQLGKRLASQRHAPAINSRQ